MENAVIYARYSSHNQTENSIEAQVAEAKAYAKRKNYTITHIYADRAKTGTNDNREAFQKMLSATEHHNFTVIIVWKVDRFGRNREEIALNKHRCKKNGVRVEYVAENISDGPEGVILESVLEGFAEYYSRQLSQNVKRGMKNTILKGQFTGGRVPLGYKVVNGKFEIDEENAKKIKDVFKLFNHGHSFVEIANKLDLHVRNIPVYLRHDFYYTGTYSRGDVHIENFMPKLITKEEYNLAKKNLNSYTKHRAPFEYPLTGKVFCTCGAKYAGKTHENKYAYYVCKCKDDNKIHSVHKDEIEKDVLNKAYAILRDPKSIDELTDKVYEKLKLRVKDLNHSAKKESLNTRRKRLLDLVESGALPGDDPDLRERLNKLDAELMKFSCDGTSIPIINRADIKRYIVGVKSLKDEKSLIGAFINKIIVDPTTKEWTIYYGPNF